MKDGNSHMVLELFLPSSYCFVLLPLCPNPSVSGNAILGRRAGKGPVTLKIPRRHFEAEKADLNAEIREKQELGTASWRKVFSSDDMMRRRVFLGFLFFAVQQLSGGGAISFYAPDILNTLFTDDYLP